METTTTLDIPADKGVILFDGVCNLCSGFVQFTIPRDPKAYYKFVSIQSETGQAILKHFGLSTDEISTVVLVEDGKAYTHSDVGLKMFRRFPGLWPLLYVFWYVPRPIRDAVYNWIARNRYNWFGKSEACWLPTPELKSRFLN